MVSGPGSGKTEMFARRVVFLVTECGVAPRNILGFTFTKNASLEMKERVEKISPSKEVATLMEDVRLCTFHSFSHKLCMTTLQKNETLTVFGTQQCIEILEECLAEVRANESESSLDAQAAHREWNKKALYNMIQIEKVKFGGEERLFTDALIGEVYKLYKVVF